MKERGRRPEFFARWAGSVISAGLLVVWIGSMLGSVEYRWTRHALREYERSRPEAHWVDDFSSVYIADGVVGHWRYLEPGIYLSNENAYQASRSRPKELAAIEAQPWKLHFEPTLPARWWPGSWPGGEYYNTEQVWWFPLWLPFALSSGADTVPMVPRSAAARRPLPLRLRPDRQRERALPGVRW